MHCSRIHSSVKLSTQKVYICILIVAVSCKISVSNYWRWNMYIHVCTLNTYVYLKLYNLNINLRQWNLESHKFYCFIKDRWTLSLWSIYWILSMLTFSVCGAVGGGGGEGGYFFVVVLMLFSNWKPNTKSFSCQTNRIWKNIFIDNIFNANNTLAMSNCGPRLFELILYIPVMRGSRNFCQKGPNLTTFFLFLFF